MKKNIFKFTAAILASCAVLSACSGGGDYSGYSSAYNKVTANGGMEANFNVTLKMDGQTTSSTGNFKLDTSGNKQILYYEMNVDGAKVVQFSDGEYLYTDVDGHKTKYALNSKPSAGSDSQEGGHKDSSGTFDTGAFLSEFSSFLEAGKIKELGLLSPIEKNAVTNISFADNTYTLTFSESLVKTYLNILIANETKSSGTTLQINELKDLTYKATVSNDTISGVQYTGVLAVHVPGSLMADGSDADYNMDMDIKITFVNPGSAVSVDLPSTDGYQSV